MENQVKEEIAVGDTVEGIVVAVDRTNVYIDLPPYGTGIIYGREFLVAKDILRKTKVGDTVSAKIISLETPSGYIDLSMKEARRALIWAEMEAAIESGRIYNVKVKDANRGGLVIEWNGIRGFLPASHLNENHYPSVLNGDKDNILSELKKLIGENLDIKIVSADPKTNNLIFTEVKTGQEEGPDSGIAIEYNVGDVKKGVVTGIVDFGVFVKIDKSVEGLVHISEMDWGLIDNPHRFYTVGDQVTVKIVEISEGKYSFSFKALKKNPWEDSEERYKVGDVVNGVVIKYGPHGAFASIEAGVSGLVHISHFENSEENLRNVLEIGKTYEFVIGTFIPKEQKLFLVPKDKYETNKKEA